MRLPDRTAICAGADIFLRPALFFKIFEPII
jgi:hypothetical protein